MSDTVSGEGGPIDDGRAAERELTLAQAVLAPLDAIFEAQVHAARSFLNMVLQLGYPHRPTAEQVDGQPTPSLHDQKAFMIDFLHEADIEVEKDDGSREVERVFQKVSVPALSLIPVAPLAVREAEFTMEMAVRAVERRHQLQSERRKSEAMARGAKESDLEGGSEPRPWYLVEDPMTLRGVIAPPRSAEGDAQRRGEAAVKINIKVGAIPTPAGLDRLLASVGHLTSQERLTESEPEPGEGEA